MGVYHAVWPVGLADADYYQDDPPPAEKGSPGMNCPCFRCPDCTALFRPGTMRCFNRRCNRQFSYDLHGEPDEKEVDDAACVIEANPGRALAENIAKRDKEHEAKVRKHIRKWEENNGGISSYHGQQRVGSLLSPRRCSRTGMTFGKTTGRPLSTSIL